MERYQEIADRRARRFRRGMIFNSFVVFFLGGFSLFSACVENIGTLLRVFAVIQGIVFVTFGGWSFRRYVIQSHSGHDDLKL
jgi:hypothetical protein